MENNLGNPAATWRVVKRNQVPAFAETDTFANVYRALAQSGHGAFVLLDRGRTPMGIVRADDFANHVIANPDGPALAKSFDTAIGKLMPRDGKGVLAPARMADPGSAESMAQGSLGNDQILEVTDNQQVLGLVFGDSVADIFTRRTVFICARGHRNTDPDSGRCSVCPAPIVGTEKE